jgi:two-component system cell cycle response regulator
MEPLSLPPLVDRPARILLFTGDDMLAEDLARVLEADGHEPLIADQGGRAIEHVRETLPDLVLLDLGLPGGAALETLGDLRMVDALRLLPIVVLGDGELDERVVAMCLLGGADDVVDPRRLCELSARVAVQLRNRRDRDLLRRVEKERSRLLDDAFTDALTGIGNRRAADLALAQEVDDESAALLMIVDVDHFKKVNDTYGHAVGDQVLRAVGRCLVRLARDGDVVARFGGEEFVVLIRDAPPSSHGAIVERFHRGVRALRPRVGPPRITASIGAVTLPPRSLDDHAEERPRTLGGLFELADQCLYRAKRGGRDAIVHVWNGELRDDPIGAAPISSEEMP